MIPNPRKKVTVDFTVPEIKSALVKIPTYFNNKYTLDKINDLLNQFTFGALEFLSSGVFADINLNYITETKTEIIVEVRRKIGAFDQWFEVQKANQHIDNLFNGISVLLTNLRKTATENIIQVNVDNPSQVVSYDLSRSDWERHLNSFLGTYPGTYKQVSDNHSTEIVLRRLPQKGDDVVLDKDAIIKITDISSNADSCEVKFLITNENNKIETQGELKRNTLILKITINLIQKIINDLKNKITLAETELQNIEKWKVGRSDATKQEQKKVQTNIIEELKQKLKKA